MKGGLTGVSLRLTVITACIASLATPAEAIQPAGTTPISTSIGAPRAMQPLFGGSLASPTSYRDATAASSPTSRPASSDPSETKTTYRVVPGDNLWKISAALLADRIGLDRGRLSNRRIAIYWLKVVSANLASLRSGDPDLIYPGEIVKLPSQGQQIDLVPPPAPIIVQHPENPTRGTSARFGFSQKLAGTSFMCQLDGGGLEACVSPIEYPGPLGEGRHRFEVISINRAGKSATSAFAWLIDRTAPLPDPSQVAPPVDPTIATSVYSATEFLYTGEDPIQSGVSPGTIDEQRVAVARGRVLARDGKPIPGVAISVLDHPEYGRTESRSDGAYDIVANGGGPLILNFSHHGFLTAQRQVQVPWADFVPVPDVVLIPYDARVTTIDPGSSDPIQVARGTPVTDADGTRQATLFFPEGTTATMRLPDGSARPLTMMHVRATEYTVGENGNESMPSELPPTSGYTYAVEFSVDEAVAAGAVGVDFDKPVVGYFENFLNFPVGEHVPIGYYDRVEGKWIPSEDGVVLEVVSVTRRMADVDLDGDAVAETSSELAAAGIADPERQQLALLYGVGQTLWRVAVRHFSPWDCNWPYGLPADAAPPGQPDPQPDKPVEKGCTVPGSIIECENQVLGESIPLTGMPFTLNYWSNRVPGYRPAYAVNIPLRGATVPSSLKRIDVQVAVAGRVFYEKHPKTDKSATFSWDGVDAYGRMVQGEQVVTVSVGYVYQAVYQQSASGGRGSAFMGDSFLRWSGILTAHRGRREITSWQRWTGTIGNWNASPEELDGWTLGVHHSYDSVGHVLHLGDGRNYRAAALPDVITTVAGTGLPGFGGDGGKATAAKLSSPRGLAVDANGALYIADTNNNRIRRVERDGVITTYAGNGKPTGAVGDEGPATLATIRGPADLAIRRDGSLYVTAPAEFRIRLVDLGHIIHTAVGTGIGCLPQTSGCGDGGPAAEAELYGIRGISAGPNDELFVSNNTRIRRVGPDGLIDTVSGGDNSGFEGDGGPALRGIFHQSAGQAVGPDGSLYVADSSNGRIRRISPDGLLTTVVGNGGMCVSHTALCGDGGPATEAQLSQPWDVAVGPDGSLYIADRGNCRVRMVRPDGIISTIAGTGTCGYAGDIGPAVSANLKDPQSLAISSDGTLYISDSGNHRVRRVSPATPAASLGTFVVPSRDGNEAFVFDNNGRHLRTLNALTGGVLYRFGYNSAGYLSTVTDGDGNVTTLERDADSEPTAIVAPGGQRTELGVGGDDYLAEVTNPAGEETLLAYAPGGLLLELADPRSKVHTFTYDALGRLEMDQDPAGGSVTLTRTDTETGWVVETTSGLGRIRTYEVERMPDGGLLRAVTDAAGLRTEAIFSSNGSTTTTFPNGMVQTSLMGPDPRWGMQAPVTSNSTVTMLSGLSRTQ